jgi:hypothetical protein
MCHDCLPSRPVLGGYLIVVRTYKPLASSLKHVRITELLTGSGLLEKDNKIKEPPVF